MKKEIELKYRIKSKRDFELFAYFLEAYLAKEKVFYSQENFYFDTPGLHLKKNGMTLRLRKQNDDFLLTAKHSLRKQKKNLSVRMEYQGALSPEVASLILNNYLSPIDAFSSLSAATEEELQTKKILYQHMLKASTLGVGLIGSFCNSRTSFPIELMEQSLELEFDHSIFLETVETFEIEVEFPSEKEAFFFKPVLDQLFSAAGIKTYNASSKSGRLFKLLFKE